MKRIMWAGKEEECLCMCVFIFTLPKELQRVIFPIYMYKCADMSAQSIKKTIHWINTDINRQPDS